MTLDLLTWTPESYKAAQTQPIPGEVRELFRRFACEARDAGLSRYSADAILHRIRWEMRIVKRGEFACNNNWTSTLARDLIASDPRFRGFFELRERRT